MFRKLFYKSGSALDFKFVSAPAQYVSDRIFISYQSVFSFQLREITKYPVNNEFYLDKTFINVLYINQSHDKGAVDKSKLILRPDTVRRKGIPPKGHCLSVGEMPPGSAENIRRTVT